MILDLNPPLASTCPAETKRCSKQRKATSKPTNEEERGVTPIQGLTDPTPPPEHTTTKKREAWSTLFHKRGVVSLIRAPPGNTDHKQAPAEEKKRQTRLPSSTPPPETSPRKTPPSASPKAVGSKRCRHGSDLATSTRNERRQ